MSKVALLSWGDVGAAGGDVVGWRERWDGGGRCGRGRCGGRGDADFDGVDFAVVDGWGEGEAVFVADELGDLGVDGGVVLRVSGEEDAAAGGVG